MTLTFEELLAYSDGERAKWRQWFGAQPGAVLDAPVQPGARFATVWHLLDHVAGVEARHLERLRRGEIPTSTGVAHGDIEGLFTYWERARQGLRAYGASCDDEAVPRTFLMGDGKTYTVTPRKLAFHVLLHETRHLAQIAAAVRNAGYAPPGCHDLLCTEAIA